MREYGILDALFTRQHQIVVGIIGQVAGFGVVFFGVLMTADPSFLKRAVFTVIITLNMLTSDVTISSAPTLTSR